MAFVEGQLNSYLKACSAEPLVDQALRNGRAVLHFQSEHVGAEEPVPVQNFFVHIPLLYLRPYRATFLELELSPSQPEVVLPHLPSQVEQAAALRGSDEVLLFRVGRDQDGIPPFRTCLELLNALNLDVAWFVKVLSLSTRCRPVARLDGDVSVLHTTCPSTSIWHPNDRQRRRRRGPQVVVGVEGDPANDPDPDAHTDSEQAPEIHQDGGAPDDHEGSVRDDDDDHDEDENMNDADVDNVFAEAAAAETTTSGDPHLQEMTESPQAPSQGPKISM